jgi:hypothetical protein
MNVSVTKVVTKRSSGGHNLDVEEVISRGARRAVVLPRAKRKYNARSRQSPAAKRRGEVGRVALARCKQRQWFHTCGRMVGLFHARRMACRQ